MKCTSLHRVEIVQMTAFTSENKKRADAYPWWEKLCQDILASGRYGDFRTLDHVALINQFLYYARWVLLLFSASLYLVGPFNFPWIIKLLVIATMLVATVLAISLYNSDDIKQVMSSFANFDPNESTAERMLKLSPLRTLIATETMGIALLILPTGGIQSPFVWYAVNPLLVASIFLPWSYCWKMLLLFLSTAVGATLVYPGLPGAMLSFLLQQAVIFAALIFVTALLQLTAYLLRRLITACMGLEEAHERSSAALAQISSIHQALQSLSEQEDGNSAAQLLAEYTMKLCSGPGLCVLIAPVENHHQQISEPTRIIQASESFPQLIVQLIADRPFENLNCGVGIIKEEIPELDAVLVMTPVCHYAEYFGWLAYLQSDRDNSVHEDSLVYLARLGGMTLGRLRARDLWGRILVTEEQNRIANEIHDGVAQYLFSMVCSLHSLSKQDLPLQNYRVQEQLQLLTDTAQRAFRELRDSIYQLSPRQRGDQVFLNNLALYLDDLGRLHRVRVDLQYEGQEDNLSPVLRQALHRVVREAASNALRHGGCSNLQVKLRMHPGKTELSVEDNGKGFNNRSKEAPGMGFANMRQLAERFDGVLNIESEPGKGTRVHLSIPR